MASDKQKALISLSEERSVRRKVIEWFNTCPYLPDGLTVSDFLPADDEGMAIITEIAQITARYIVGGHRAEYTFGLWFRTASQNTDQRLLADEALADIAEWAEQELPSLGENVRALRLRKNSIPQLMSRYDDGAEDHQISMTLQYEVK